jgi:hypothetical protein
MEAAKDWIIEPKIFERSSEQFFALLLQCICRRAQQCFEERKDG